MSCCPEGSLPGLQEDSSRTLSGVVEGKNYYVAPADPSSTIGILVVYDVFGFSGGRIKSVCDSLALGTNAHVCMPDVYDGTEIVAKGGFGNPEAMQWLKSMTEWSTLSKLLAPGLDCLKAKGVTKIGAIGFCWGVYGVVKLAAEPGLLSAAVGCHPSLKIGNMFFEETEDSQAAMVKAPLCIMPAGNDPDMYRPTGSIPKIIQANGFECKSIDFPEMQHGWVPRGDASLPAVARDVQKALDEAIAFFKKYLL